MKFNYGTYLSSYFHFHIGNLFFFTVSGRLMSRYKHTDDVHNSGVVWGRLFQIHPALLLQVEVNVSVATEWDNQQIPVPTTGKINQHSPTDNTIIVIFTHRDFSLSRNFSSEGCLSFDDVIPENDDNNKPRDLVSSKLTVQFRLFVIALFHPWFQWWKYSDPLPK